MRRIVSVCLPQWPIERLAAMLRQRDRSPGEAASAVLSGVPFALVEAGQRGVRLCAVNAAARALGIRAGDALASARAVLPALAAREAQPAADRAGLRQLARWLGRYGIARNAYGLKLESASGHALRCYGLWVDIAGVAHLFGGEAALLQDMRARLSGFGLTARLGLADTLGAAHALAWHGGGADVAAPGATLGAISRLPVAGLRLDAAPAHLLERLGFKTIGALARVPRAALERRFCGSSDGERVLLRLDQALGVRPEPRRPLVEVAAFSVRQPFAAPLISSDILMREAGVLMAALCVQLEAAGQGARLVRLSLYRSDGSVAAAEAGTSQPSRAASHLMGLLAEKIVCLDLGFGVDLLTLEAVHAEPACVRQEALTGGGENATLAQQAALIDRLVNRFGGPRVTAIEPRASHWPERGAVRVSVAARKRTLEPVVSSSLRPAVLLSPPEPIDVIAAVPEGAPLRFNWRRVRHIIVRSDGPERIEPEWWREAGRLPSPSRDYYALEDGAGGRFWVFRAGRYHCGEPPSGSQADLSPGCPPAWFIHGLFC